MLIKAFFVAVRAHKGQKDKAGKAYILHPVNVALRTKGVKGKIVALLHDTVEDTSVTLAYLKERGFDDDIVNAVSAITKRKKESYCAYLQRVKCNELAKKVKLADLEHNSNLKRLRSVTPKDIARCEKYKQAKEYLNSVRRYAW